jgi:glutaconyl-CoA/methylmalonyl-CoA decarboxylase subunit gamma
MKLRIKVDLQTFEVEVGDINERPVRVSVDGDTFEIWPEEIAAPAEAPAAALLSPSPISSAVAAPPSPPAVPAGDRTRAVTAPIPGVILSINVKVGDQVAFGQELCILEAMKMKNQIRANRAGKILSIHISPGDQVRHSQVLMEYAD